MAKAAKKKSKPNTKSARVSSQPKAAKKKAAKPVRTAARIMATAKIDPLNRKQYGALTPGLNVRDIRRAAEFYKTAFGFTVRSIMDTPQGAVHAELRLRDSTLMLSPEARERTNLSANSFGNTPATF